jgi:hypothetical protein
MYQLENRHIKIGFDAQARLALLSIAGGNVIAAPAAASFKLVFRKGENWENTAVSANQSFTVCEEPDAVTFTTQTLQYSGGTAQIGLTLKARLDGENLRFTAEIDNREPNAWVTDFEYPYIGVVRGLGESVHSAGPELLFPIQSGMRVPDIGRFLSGHGDSRVGATTFGSGPSRESGGCSFGSTYPGYASMQWMALEQAGRTLFLQSQDADHHVTDLRVLGAPTEDGDVTLVIDKLAFVREGEIWQAPDAVLSFYAGSWHKGADLYAQWAKTWRPTYEKPEWVKNMNGYYLVIMKQQFGVEMWPYNTIPKLYELAKDTGCDTVGLFGWYDSGHDNQYPDLKVSESLGGAQALKDGIRQVQEEGGSVTLYYQGHLIDTTTDFYQNGGEQYVCRSKDGIPYLEWYNKAHNSSYLKYFTNKSFATSCPCCPEWQKLMKEKAEWVRSFGPNGVLYDQIGGMPPRPCFDERHPHPKGKPSLSMPGGRKQLMDGIQRRTKELDPQYGFFSEHITDVYSAYLDGVHGISSYPSGEGDWGSGTKDVHNYPELFRYCFPETIITIRNPRPYLEKRAVNYACAYGFRFELEVRYDADCEDVLAERYTAENHYAKQAGDLRRRHWDLLGLGRFVDSLPLRKNNEQVLAKAFENGGQLAVVLWNDSDQPQDVNLEVPGWEAESVDSTEGPLPELPKTLEPQRLLVQVFHRSGV